MFKGAPELSDALDAARLRHATPEQIFEIAAKYGYQPGDVNAFARGKDIFVPPGRGVGLRTLAHEVTHVNQFMAVRNFNQSYNAAFQRGLARGLSPADAYRFNTYEISARRVGENVIRAYSP